MSVTGLESQVRDDEAGWTAAVSPAPDHVDDGFRIEDIEAEPEPTIWPRLFAGLLILLALGWIGASVYALTLTPPGPGLAAWLAWAGGFSMPLVLLGMIWLTFG